MAKRKTGPGRPPGSKTQDLPHVRTVPPECPKCHGTDTKVLATKRRRDIAGVFQGFAYDHVTWRRKRCRSCHQVFNEVEYGADGTPSTPAENTDSEFPA